MPVFIEATGWHHGNRIVASRSLAAPARALMASMASSTGALGQVRVASVSQCRSTQRCLHPCRVPLSSNTRRRVVRAAAEEEDQAKKAAALAALQGALGDNKTLQAMQKDADLVRWTIRTLEAAKTLAESDGGGKGGSGSGGGGGGFWGRFGGEGGMFDPESRQEMKTTIGAIMLLFFVVGTARSRWSRGCYLRPVLLISSWKELFGLLVNLIFLFAPKPQENVDEELVPAAAGGDLGAIESEVASKWAADDE
eukprot:scaffold906_cov395-Prasinococcus_capsulatus_cf.AAC.6